MEIEEKLERLKKITPLHPDISYLYNKYSKELDFLKSLEKEGLKIDVSKKELERKVERALEMAKRFKKKHDYFENVKKELESSNVTHVVFVTPLVNNKIGIRVKKIDEIESVSSGEYMEEDLTDAIRKISKIEKIGKVAVCKPVGYGLYECKYDNKKVILDYS